MTKEKREIMEQMVAEGYHLMGRTIESYEVFTVEQLKSFLESFRKWKKG